MNVHAYQCVRCRYSRNHNEKQQSPIASSSLTDTPGAVLRKGTRDADFAFTDEGTTGGGLEGVEVARRLPDPVPVNESKEADDTFKVEGTVGGVEAVDVAHSVSCANPVNGSSWFANGRLQGRGQNPTGVERANLPFIVGSLRRRLASVSSMVCRPTMARLHPLEGSPSRRCFPLIVRRLFAQGVAGGRCCLHG